LGRASRALVATAVLVAAVGAWWSGEVPCGVVGAQPACQLAVTGGPVLDAAALAVVRPTGVQGGDIAVREPAGRLLVTTIEVWEPGSVGAWWEALRDPAVDLVARSRLVPRGGDLEDVAEEGRERMAESQALAVGLALDTLGLVVAPDVPVWAWPVTVSTATEEVGGPSAGLMLALSVIAQLAPDDPTARPDGAASGRPPLVVAGTGALEPDGRVLGVGGLEHKLRSVIADARGGTLPDAFLLPAEDLAIARRVPLARDLLLVPVSDLAGAVDALAVLARGARPEGAVLVAATDRGGR
jgi:PDZ domain-containing secreted protein